MVVPNAIAEPTGQPTSKATKFKLNLSIKILVAGSNAPTNKLIIKPSPTKPTPIVSAETIALLNFILSIKPKIKIIIGNITVEPRDVIKFVIDMIYSMVSSVFYLSNIIIINFLIFVKFLS